MPADALPSAPSAIMAPGTVGAFRLLVAFRREHEDPASFYRLLARDSVALVARYAQLDGSQVLSLVRRRADVAVVEARPRYYPRWCRFLIFLPGLRELLTRNLLLILRRRA